MGFFKGKVAGAEKFEKGQFFTPGKYEIEIEKVLTKEQRKTKALLFIVECRVTASDNEANPVGSKRSWIQNTTADGAWGEVRVFGEAAATSKLGYDPLDDATQLREKIFPMVEDLLEQAVEEAQPFRGTRLRLECWTRQKKDGGDFTVHEWSAPRKAKKAA